MGIQFYIDCLRRRRIADFSDGKQLKRFNIKSVILSFGILMEWFIMLFLQIIRGTFVGPRKKYHKHLRWVLEIWRRIDLIDLSCISWIIRRIVCLLVIACWWSNSQSVKQPLCTESMGLNSNRKVACMPGNPFRSKGTYNLTHPDEEVLGSSCYSHSEKRILWSIPDWFAVQWYCDSVHQGPLNKIPSYFIRSICLGRRFYSTFA